MRGATRSSRHLSLRRVLAGIGARLAHPPVPRDEIDWSENTHSNVRGIGDQEALDDVPEERALEGLMLDNEATLVRKVGGPRRAARQLDEILPCNLLLFCEAARLVGTEPARGILANHQMKRIGGLSAKLRNDATLADRVSVVSVLEVRLLEQADNVAAFLFLGGVIGRGAEPEPLETRFADRASVDAGACLLEREHASIVVSAELFKQEIGAGASACGTVKVKGKLRRLTVLVVNGCDKVLINRVVTAASLDLSLPLEQDLAGIFTPAAASGIKKFEELVSTAPNLPRDVAELGVLIKRVLDEEHAVKMTEGAENAKVSSSVGARDAHLAVVIRSESCDLAGCEIDAIKKVVSSSLGSGCRQADCESKVCAGSECSKENKAPGVEHPPAAHGISGAIRLPPANGGVLEEGSQQLVRDYSKVADRGVVLRLDLTYEDV